ncbi:MAG: hypothetical protein WAV38_09035 [Xanthobacteraceae bacterium]
MFLKLLPSAPSYLTALQLFSAAWPDRELPPRFESLFSPLQLSLALQHKSVSRQLFFPLDDNADEVPSVAMLHF